MKINNVYNNNKHYNRELSPYSGVFNSSFKGAFFSKIALNHTVPHNEASKLISSIDGILGKDGFFSSHIEKAKKAGLKINNNSLILKKPTFFGDVLSTITYPFVDMPFDILNSVSKGLQKIGLSNIGNKIQTNGFIKNGIAKSQAKKSYALVNSILEQFEQDKKGDFQEWEESFSRITTGKISSIAKKYSSRDERTLNRFVTGTVGAILSSVDMYNISMLEKNDKKSAKKAKKDRFEQEMIRIGISSGLTFLSLGALNKYAKGSVLKSALIVAGSTLFAEVVSRLRKHKPLGPISPERAKKIAEKNESKNPAKINDTKIALTRLDKNDKNSLFKNFTQNFENKQEINTETIDDNTQNKKKKRSPLATIGAISLAASMFYIATRYAKGEYLAKAKRKDVYEKFQKEIDAFIDDGKMLDPQIVNEIKNVVGLKEKAGIIKQLNSRINKIVPDRIIKKIFSYKSNLANKNYIENSTKSIQRELDAILEQQNAKDIEPLINIYKKHNEFLMQNGIKSVSTSTKNPICSAIFAGLTKLINTVYSILALPGAAVDKAINSALYRKSEKSIENAYKNFVKFDKDTKVKVYSKEIQSLSELLTSNNGKVNKYERVADQIKNRSRNFEQGSETGDLANLSRTLVTLISSWFYVNDFSNTVLIESKGKNTERAREVRNESIGFKLANFFFNGTLMNLANSIFKEQLNNSLIGATIIPIGTEIANEALIRKTISRPMHQLNSREEIIEYDQKRASKKGLMGAWTRFFKKITGQKSLVEKYEAQQAKKNG